ncbi:MAG: Capsular polysaccharide type 8 biosynthesis protein cap8A [Pelotomaculum sp. PtaB.Bin117]|nr:MAG: Capsular polysaccharide type 8 biosynthesis protein cap8A [Pelotomaculum sp. PtaB.Bin117]OPY62874.1 MAG: Capsular polysaccharide type 8 biosynthesis protein cap8A [Pelotomaculum sp. PtaU1.Bin065]
MCRSMKNVKGVDELLDNIDFSALIKRRLFLVLATIIIALTAGGAACMILPAKYQASTILRLSQPENGSENSTGANRMDYNSLMMYRQLARTYCELAESEQVLRKLSERVEHSLSSGDLRRMITVRKVKDLELLEILVKDTDPYRAAFIAGSLAVLLQQEEKEVWKMNNLQVIIPASPDERPVGPNIFMSMLVAGLAGALIAFMLAAVLEYTGSWRE